MRFGKSIGGGWIMPQMCIDRIAPAIGGGDFGDGAIDLADAMLGGRDRNDRAIVRRPESLAPADIDIVRASVGRLVDQIVAVIRDQQRGVKGKSVAVRLEFVGGCKDKKKKK